MYKILFATTLLCFCSNISFAWLTTEVTQYDKSNLNVSPCAECWTGACDRNSCYVEEQPICPSSCIKMDSDSYLIEISQQ